MTKPKDLDGPKKREQALVAAIAEHAGRRIVGLRFDKVVLGVIERLRGGLRDVVPDARTIVVTITAPILVPARTAEGLIEKSRSLVSDDARDAKLTVHGNRVRLRFATNHDSGRAPKVLVFVHNPEVDARGILRAATAWLGPPRRRGTAGSS